MRSRFLRSAALAAMVALAACSASQAPGTGPSVVPFANSRHVLDQLGGPPMDFSAYMYDAPLPAGRDAHVYLAIAGMDVMSDGVAHKLVAYAEPQTVDLLTLKHSALTLKGLLPAGAYDTIRLLVDTRDSKVVVDGRDYPMVFAKHSRKRHQPAIVALDAAVWVAGAAGESVSVDVDFNVLESISLRGGTAYAKPKLVVARTPARVIGRIVNDFGKPVVNATVVATDKNGHVANTTITEADGSFTIHALKAGAYTISVVNSYVTESDDAVLADGATKGGSSVDVVLAPSDVLDLGTLSD